jgi:hypothetical protein
MLTKTLATNQPRFYSWLRYLENVFTEALPSSVLFQLVVPEAYFNNTLSSSGLFRHNIFILHAINVIIISGVSMCIWLKKQKQDKNKITQKLISYNRVKWNRKRFRWSLKENGSFVKVMPYICTTKMLSKNEAREFTITNLTNPYARSLCEKNFSFFLP